MSNISKMKILKSVLSIFISSATVSQAHSATSKADFEHRRDLALEQLTIRPYPNPLCKIPAIVQDRCLWGQLVQIIAHIAREDNVREINTQLEASLDRLRQMTAASNRSESANDRVYSLYFLTGGLLFRILKMADTAIGTGPKILSPDNRAKVIRLFGDWARSECKVANATPSRVWEIWGSENHGLQHNQTCWAAATLLLDNPEAVSAAYYDGSNAQQQAEAWTRYLKLYLAERGRHGMLIEYFSPTYTDYTLVNVYNFFDFATDPELRRLSRSFLDLWWAMWAQEQIGGVHGGSKARAYPSAISANGPAVGLGWLYFGFSNSSSLTSRPANIIPVTSRYVMPDAVVRIALRSHSEVPYEVWTRTLGVSTRSRQDNWYHVDPSNGRILRYVYVTREFVMGSAMRSPLPEERWTEISSQNTWSGLTLFGKSAKRIYVTVEATGSRSTYNSTRVVQSHGAQLIQKNVGKFGKGLGKTSIVIESGLQQIERDGWLFVDGSAYVAVRPITGGYRSNYSSGRFTLNNDTSPVVIQASPRLAYPNFKAFQEAILARELQAQDNGATFDGLDGAGVIALPADPAKPVTINGSSVNFDSSFALKSPFVVGDWAGGKIRIGAGTVVDQLEFK